MTTDWEVLKYGRISGQDNDLFHGQGWSTVQGALYFLCTV